MRLRITTRLLCALLVLGGIDQTTRAQAPQTGDGKRELTISGCLLRSGYAGYQIDEARLEVIEGKPIPEAQMTAAQVGVPKKWTLDGGGNLGPRVGEKVLVVGRSDWREPGTATAPVDEPPGKGPTLEVKSVKTVESRCS